MNCINNINKISACGFDLLFSLIFLVVLLSTCAFKVAMRSKGSTPFSFVLRIICFVYASNCFPALLFVLTSKHANMFLSLYS